MDSYVEDWVAEFAATADRSPDAMCLRGSDGLVSYVNESGLRLVGAQDASEVVEFSDSVFGFVDDVNGPVARALSEGGSWTGDFRIRHVRTGEAVPVWVSAYVVTGRHARTPVVAMAYRDLRGVSNVSLGCVQNWGPFRRMRESSGR